MPQLVNVYKNPDCFDQEPSSIHIVQQPRQIIRKQPENLDLSQARYEGRSPNIEGVNPYPDHSCSAKEFRQWIRDYTCYPLIFSELDNKTFILRRSSSYYCQQ